MTDSHIGYSLYISDSLPATNDAAGFEALTWTEVSGLQVGPQLGITHSMINVPDLKSGFTSKVKGPAEGVSTTMTFRKVSSDTGQATLKTQSEDQEGELSVKLVKGTGTDNAPQTGDLVEYAQGVAHSYQPMQPGDGSHEGFQVTFDQNDYTITSTEPS